jgi:hypothetical protein
VKQFPQDVLYYDSSLFVNVSLRFKFHSTNGLDRAWRGPIVRCRAVKCHEGTPGRLMTFATGRDKIDRDRTSQTVTSKAGVPDNDLPAPGSWGSAFVCLLA